MAKSPTDNLLLFIQPNFTKIMLLVIFIAIASFVTTGQEATSKVSWVEYRGIPFNFLILSGYQGLCSNGTFCREISISDFHLYAFLINIILWYFFSCALALFLNSIKIREKFRGLHQ